METSSSLELAKTFLGTYVEVTIDRPLGSTHPKHGFAYACNYGCIKGIPAPDGEDLDAYVLGVSGPLTTMVGVCIAIAHRTNDDDDKLIVVPEGTVLSDTDILDAIYFQEQWFDTVIVRT